MAKSASINFDDKSLEILKGVDSIHRDSLINVGLALVSKTGYYATLTGQADSDLTKVASLEDLDKVLEEEQQVEEVKTQAATTTSDWDDF